MRRAARAASALALLGALAAAAAGCDRTPQLLPAGADSTKVKRDTLAILARRASERWDAGDDEQGSAMSAGVVLQALRLRPNAPWPQRAKGFLDSLGVASEVAGDQRAIVVNMFSRARGADASYPYLFWHDESPRMQALEATDLHLADVAARGFTPESKPSDTAQVAVLWGRRAGPGQQPILMVWRYAKGGRWNLAQTLGPDSLGGTGTGEFTGERSNAGLDVRTYRPTPYFEECATCPHVMHERTWVWGTDGFTRTADDVVPSPYAAFTSFVQALVAGDRARAARYVADPALIDFAYRFEWQVPSRGRWRLAPASDESLTAMIFLRGTSDAYRVAFQARDGDWVVSGFEPTVRPLE